MKIVMATEKLKIFFRFSRENAENRAAFGEELNDDCALSTMPCAFPCDDSKNLYFHGFPIAFAFMRTASSRFSQRFSRIDHVDFHYLFAFSSSLHSLYESLTLRVFRPTEWNLISKDIATAHGKSLNGTRRSTWLLWRPKSLRECENS